MGAGENVEAQSIKHLEGIMGECILSRERVFKLYIKQKPKRKILIISTTLRTFCSLEKLGTFCSSKTP